MASSLSPMDELSDEFFLLIFSSLSLPRDQASASSVCRRWCRLMGEMILGLHVRLRHHHSQQQHHPHHLQHHLQGGLHTAEQWQRLMQRFPNITSFRCGEMMSPMSQLTHALSRSRSSSPALSSPAAFSLPMALLAETYPNLHTLGLANCTGWSDKEIVSTLKILAAANIRLKRLELWFWSGVTNQTAEAIGATCPSLTHLHVSGTHFTNQGLLEIAQKCVKIENLVLDGLLSATGGGIIAMARGYVMKGGLLNFKACGLERSTDLIYAMMGERNSFRLRQLCLEGSGQPLDVDALASLAEECPFLEYLNLRDSRLAQPLRKETFRSSFSHLRSLFMPRDCCSQGNLKLFTAQTPNLTALYIVGQDFPYTFNCGLCDWEIAGLAATCPLLEVLYMRVNHKEFTGKGFKAGFRFLARLSMWGTFGVNNDGLEAIAFGCPKLKSLTVSQSMPITVEGLRAAIAECKSLEEITVAGSILSRSNWARAVEGTSVSLSTTPPSEWSRDFAVNAKGELDSDWEIIR